MKEKHYLILDCETATLDFVNNIVNDENEKKKIAIAKPLIYDIGWVITNRKGEIIKSVQYLISETFCVPAIYNTAYYADKRPIYLEMLEKGETSIQHWYKVMAELVEDMKTVEAVGAYNSMFDFKKAIPFTELYINKLYSKDFYNWYENQKHFCKLIIENLMPKNENEFDPNNFHFRGNDYPLFDLWGMAVTHLLDRVKYRENCLKHNLITASGIYFKTSAESSYQYLCNQYDFIESHTALDDVKIETYIFSKIAMRHKVNIGIEYFPFKKLGYTDEFVMNMKKTKIEYVNTVIDAISIHIGAKDPTTNYVRAMTKRLEALQEFADNLVE